MYRTCIRVWVCVCLCVSVPFCKILSHTRSPARKFGPPHALKPLCVRVRVRVCACVRVCV